MDELNSRVEHTFHEALSRTDPVERASYIQKACDGDESLQVLVRRLLQAAEAAESEFLTASFKERAARAADALVENGPEVALQVAQFRPEKPGDKVGYFKLLQQIGEGGFGTVWMAEQEEPVRRRVALKIIKVGMDTKEVVARFEQERQALALMDHPNIAKVLDAGATPSGRPYFAMELVRGVPITEYCDTNNVSMDERLRLFVQVCAAVQHAHQKGIIHRDLKPSNLLVSMQDGMPVPKVIDFGVAKATQSKLTDLSVYTHFECMVGTPLYMSPEQAEMTNLDIDTRTDIYSLGVLLYELLTGKTPFNAEELMRCGLDEVRRVIREEDPPKPSTALSTVAGDLLTTIAKRRRTLVPTLISTLKGDLDWIVMRAIEKDRTRRYDTADSLARDIDRHLNHEPVLARPPSRIYRFHRMVRRNRMAFGAAAALAATLILGAVVSTWQAVRATKAQAEMAAERDAKERALVLARASEADTEAFGTFLVDRLLAAARPQDVDGGLGVDVTVAHALEEAEKLLERDFDGRPRAEARARDAIGVTWDSLGRYEDARRELERAVELRERYLGVNDPATLTSVNNHAVTLTRTGDLAKARRLHEQTYAKRRAVLGSSHPATLTSLNNLAAVYEQMGDYSRALQLYEQVLERSIEVLGEDHRNSIKSMNNVARVHRLNGDLEKAIGFYERALEKCRNALPPDHPYTLTTMNNLAVAYEENGQASNAVPYYKESLEKSKKKLGEWHQDTLTSMSNLAGAYVKTKDFDDAVRLYKQVLERKRAGTTPSAELEQCLTSLAVAYETAKKFNEAAPLYEEALARREKRLGDSNPETLRSMNDLAVVYTEAGRLSDALPLYEKAFAKRKLRLGLDNSDTRKSLRNLALAYRDFARYTEAVKLLEELLSALKKEHKSGDEAVTKLQEEIAAIQAQVSNP